LQETGRRKQQQQQKQKQKRGSAADQYKKGNIRGLTGENAEKGPQRLVLGGGLRARAWPWKEDDGGEGTGVRSCTRGGFKADN
jgi:hypothetical protein